FLGLGPRQRWRGGGRDQTPAGCARSRPWERARRDQFAGYARRFARGCTFGRGFDSPRLHFPSFGIPRGCALHPPWVPIWVPSAAPTRGRRGPERRRHPAPVLTRERRHPTPVVLEDHL